MLLRVVSIADSRDYRGTLELRGPPVQPAKVEG
jgi:hypothetical protein